MADIERLYVSQENNRLYEFFRQSWGIFGWKNFTDRQILYNWEIQNTCAQFSELTVSHLAIRNVQEFQVFSILSDKLNERLTCRKLIPAQDQLLNLAIAFDNLTNFGQVFVLKLVVWQIKLFNNSIAF